MILTTAVRVMIIGKLGGPWRRRPGAVIRLREAVRPSDLLYLMTVMQDSPTGELAGRTPRNGGVASMMVDLVKHCRIIFTPYGTIVTTAMIHGRPVGQIRRRSGAVLDTIGVANPHCHMTAMQAMATGRSAGLPEKRVGAAGITTGDAMKRLPCHTIAMLVIKTGKQVGRITRKNGAAFTFTAGVMFLYRTIVMQATATGRLVGRQGRRSGAVTMPTRVVQCRLPT